MKKGFMKTIALFMILLVIVVAGGIYYLNNQEDINKFREDARSTVQETVQEKKNGVVDKVIEEGKNSVGEALKEAGEKMINNDSDNVNSDDNQEVQVDVEKNK